MTTMAEVSEAEKFLQQLEIEKVEAKSKLQNEPEFENFLGQVDQVVDVIHGLASEKEGDLEKAFMKADMLLGSVNKDMGDIDETRCKVTSNRTVVNKPKNEEQGQGEMQPEAWMSMMEQDAKERYENRMKRKEKSDEFKKKGNQLFNKKDYGGALYNYNEVRTLYFCLS